MRPMSRVLNSLIVLPSLLVFCALHAGCSSTPRLTDQERLKIDPVLQRVLEGERVVELEDLSSLRPDGEREYPAIVRSNNPEDLRTIGIDVQGRFGELLTVRVTAREIAALARLESVSAIRAGSRNRPNTTHG